MNQVSIFEGQKLLYSAKAATDCELIVLPFSIVE
jgi:hypothetical protein